MARDMETQAKNLTGAAKAKGVDLGKLAALMDSVEGKALLRQISGPGGDALKKAASDAAEGDGGAVGRLLSSLMSTKEGQALAKQVMEIAKK